MTNFEQALHKKLYRGDCPSPTTLHEYYWHELSAEKTNTVTDHLAICPDCAAEDARRIMFLMPERLQPKDPNWLDKLRLFVARLKTPIVGAALRGEPGMMFETDDNQIIFLNWWQDERAYFTLSGSLFPPPAEGVTEAVKLVLLDEVFSADLQSDGEFVFNELDAGIYKAVIQFNDKQILIPHVEIATAR